MLKDIECSFSRVRSSLRNVSDEERHVEVGGRSAQAFEEGLVLGSGKIAKRVKGKSI